MAARERVFQLFLGNAPRIHVLARHHRVDRQEWLAFVVEGSRDWSLVQSIECEQVHFNRRRRDKNLVEISQIATSVQCLFVSLIFIDVLENLADLQELSDGRAFTRAQL